LYTKTGDKGQTSLYGGSRRSKADRRIAAYGDMDELLAVLGVARSHCADPELGEIIEAVQFQGFVICSQLARLGPGEPSIGREDIAWLEATVDRLDAALPPLRAFILQGGAPTGAYLHLARTVCRRAERSAVGLAGSEEVDLLCLEYLNRLSALLFVLARTANHRLGSAETTWRRKKT